MILNTIKKTISDYGILHDGESVLVGLSGGADSVCLTHALCALRDKLGITVSAAHVNHGIRGDEAERDEEFARNFAKSLGIEFYSIKLDIPDEAKKTGVSEETAGRNARYSFFTDLCQKYGIDKIATAHNKNDNAETIAMNFMRGSTIKGLGGIPRIRGNIIRPLLDVSRDEIERYCAENDLKYVTDSTNLSCDYTRNKVRSMLVPLIEREFNQSFTETVTENAVLASEDSAYIDKTARAEYERIVTGGRAEINELLSLDAAIRRRVVFYMLSDVSGTSEGIGAAYVKSALSLLNKSSGASVNLPRGVWVRNEYGFLVAEMRSDDVKPFEYTLNAGENYIPELSSAVTVAETDKRTRDGAVYLSASAHDKIIIRNRREGDVFYPCGMTGSKKVKEYFINEKIPRHVRPLTPIVEINGVIAAVGKRVDRRFLFKDKGIKIEFSKIQEVEF